MTEQTKTPETNAPPVPDGIFTEAPASVNFFGVTRKGWNLQFTIRDWDEVRLLNRFIAFTEHLEAKGVSPKPVGQQPLPPRVDAPTQPTGVFPAPQPPPVINPPANGGPREAQCVLIEVGTSYTGNKTQLKFTCNGMDFPLLFTKSVADMITLLAPIGFTPAHLVVGQKYPVNCKVFYVENVRDGKPRKDVQRVAAG